MHIVLHLQMVCLLDVLTRRGDCGTMIPHAMVHNMPSRRARSFVRVEVQGCGASVRCDGGGGRRPRDVVSAPRPMQDDFIVGRLGSVARPANGHRVVSMALWLTEQLMYEMVLPADEATAQHRTTQDLAVQVALLFLDALLGHVRQETLEVQIITCLVRPGRTGFLDVGGGIVLLVCTAANRWYWSIVPHPRRYFLPLSQQTLLVRWPELLWLTRTADPCWIRLLNWSGRDAVVLPVVIPGDTFRFLVIEMMRIRLGGSSRDGATHALQRARLTGAIQKTGTMRRRRMSVCMAGCECRRFRAAVEKPPSSRPLPRHLWSGFLRAMAMEAAARTATL